MSAYRYPALLWTSSVIGLVLLLVGEGAWDVCGFILAFLPSPILVASFLRRQR